MPTSVERLAQQLEVLRARVDRGFRTPQLTSSAIDNGSLPVKDGSGTTTVIIGRQYDGTWGAVPVAGPTPPIPSAPTGTTVPSGVVVHWDGTFVDPQPGYASPVVAPMTFSRVEVEASATPQFDGYVDKGSISSAAGGERFVAWPTSGQTFYVRLRTRDQNGKLSDPSLTITVVAGKVQLGDLGFDVAQYSGGNTIYFTTGANPTAPSWGFTTGDLWQKQVGTSSGTGGQPPVGTPLYELYRWSGSAWVLVQAQGVSTALANALVAQLAADSKAKLFTQSTTPTYTGAAGTAYWIDTSAAGGNVQKVWNGTGWATYQLGNGAIQPNSLVASNVIATGTITAALFEAILVLATTIVAGDPNGAHARMTATGFRVFRPASIVGQPPEEVVRMGTSTNDYFGVVDSAGGLVAAIDDTGAMNGRTANFKEAITVAGKLVSGTEYGYNHSYGYAPGGISPITSEIGIAHYAVDLVADHMYLIWPEICWYKNGAGGELGLRVRISNSSTTPLVTSQQVYYRVTSAVGGVGMAQHFNQPGLFSPSGNGISTGRWNMLITAANNSGVDSVGISNTTQAALLIMDLGPAKPLVGSVNRGGSTTTQPTQQYDTTITPSGWATFRGDGSLRTDVNEVIQGLDPSGSNGDGYGYWTFDLNYPSITGTVDRVDLYLYSTHWYYNSGGTAKINIISSGGSGMVKMKDDWVVPGWPKPGGRWVTVPSDWWPLFRNAASPRAIGISLGKGFSSDLTFYGRFAAGSPQLRILYTQ